MSVRRAPAERQWPAERSTGRCCPAPHKDFSDSYEKMSGKGESASEAHRRRCAQRLGAGGEQPDDCARLDADDGGVQLQSAAPLSRGGRIERERRTQNERGGHRAREAHTERERRTQSERGGHGEADDSGAAHGATGRYNLVVHCR